MSTNNLKEYVEKLIEIENEEEKYKNIFLKLKKEKEILNNNIMNFMEKNNVTNKDIIFGDRKIKYTTNNVAENITKKLIFERLKIYLKDEKIAADATNFIYSDRTSTKKNTIKITSIKERKT
jgi:hypothetical protein